MIATLIIKLENDINYYHHILLTFYIHSFPGGILALGSWICRTTSGLILPSLAV